MNQSENLPCTAFRKFAMLSGFGTEFNASYVSAVFMTNVITYKSDINIVSLNTKMDVNVNCDIRSAEIIRPFILTSIFIDDNYCLVAFNRTWNRDCLHFLPYFHSPN